MIHDVDESLKTLVRREVLDGAEIDVSFEAPTREWSAKRQRPTLSLFLYDIREDLSRRLVQREEIRSPDGFVVDRPAPPRFYKLSYLVTAWTERAVDEHRVLSATLAAFLQADALPQNVLQGTLVDYPKHVRTTIGLPLPQDRSIADVWSALGGELKPSLDLVVTAPLPPDRHFEVGPPVTEGLRATLLDTDRRTGQFRQRRPGDAEPVPVGPVEEFGYDIDEHIGEAVRAPASPS